MKDDLRSRGTTPFRDLVGFAKSMRGTLRFDLSYSLPTSRACCETALLIGPGLHGVDAKNAAAGELCAEERASERRLPSLPERPTGPGAPTVSRNDVVRTMLAPSPRMGAAFLDSEEKMP